MKLKKLFSLKKGRSRKPRANTFVLESLEPRLLLSATPMTAAVVTTDHLDYAPGETAVITTSEYQWRRSAIRGRRTGALSGEPHRRHGG